MPGSQLVNRLQDLNYRVVPVTDRNQLGLAAQTDGPMLIVVDLDVPGADVVEVIGSLKRNPSTAHIPVIAFAEEGKEELMASAKAAGASLVVNDTAVLSHLSQLLEQALRVD